MHGTDGPLANAMKDAPRAMSPLKSALTWRISLEIVVVSTVTFSCTVQNRNRY